MPAASTSPASASFRKRGEGHQGALAQDLADQLDRLATLEASDADVARRERLRQPLAAGEDDSGRAGSGELPAEVEDFLEDFGLEESRFAGNPP